MALSVGFTLASSQRSASPFRPLVDESGASLLDENNLPLLGD